MCWNAWHVSLSSTLFNFKVKKKSVYEIDRATSQSCDAENISDYFYFQKIREIEIKFQSSRLDCLIAS